MLTEELGFQPPDEDDALIKDALAMFFSFCLFGLLPLLVYVYAAIWDPSLPAHILFITAGVIAGTSLFIVGAIKSKYSTLSWQYSGLETTILGGICAVCAYLIGALVKHIVG